MLSILIINDVPEQLQRCIDSFKYQTSDNYELFLVTHKNDVTSTDKTLFKDIYVVNNFSELFNIKNEILNSLSGDYIFTISSGDLFMYDGAIEEITPFLNDVDIVCTDYMVQENIINAPEILRASDLFYNWELFNCCFIKTEALKTISGIYKSENRRLIFQTILIEILLLNHLAYKYVDITVLKREKQLENTGGYNNLTEFLSNKLPYLSKDYEELFANRKEKTEEHEIVLKKIAKTKLFKFFWKLKKSSIVNTLHYKPKAKRKYKKFLKETVKNDNQKKAEIKQKIYELPLDALNRKNDNTDIIVSLTSHSKRVFDFVPYAIYSLFSQSVKPNRIVLFINKEKWNDDNIPELLKRLKKSGLEIVYCTDVRSHTKLIPALERFPDNPIITADDDIYYDERMIEELLDAYNKSDKKTIFCHQACIPQKRNGKFIPYTEWKSSSHIKTYKKDYPHGISPYGVNGVIYPPHIFPKEVFNTSLFLKIAPHTDDIWFWLMEYMNNSKAVLIENTHFEQNRIINLIEYLEEDQSDALYFQNHFFGRNNKELKALLDHYQIENTSNE